MEETVAVEPCRFITSADDLAWDDTADLVVVGFGGAGVVAALEGLERGATVIALDRFDGGGATALSGGIVYAGGTEQQKEAGYNDCAEAMRRYLELENVPVSSETLQHFCDSSAANLAWLTSQGVEFDSSLYTGKATYPPEGKFLYFCGNEKLPTYAAIAKPAPRGHRTVGKGFTGRIYFDALRRSALAKGAKLISHAPVRRLIVDKSGAVVGLEADLLPEERVKEHQKLYRKVNPILPLNGKRAERAIAQCRMLEENAGTKRIRVRATRGVVLATGGFIYGMEHLTRHRPDLAAVYPALMRMGSMGCDGSGIALGTTAGGVTALMENTFIGRSLSPPEAFLHGLLINREGKRFVNEDAYIGTVGNAIIRQSDSGSAWLVTDKKTFWRGIKDAFSLGFGMFFYWGLPALINITLGKTRRAATLDKLAKKCGIDYRQLKCTIAQYNEDVAENRADPLGKQPANCAVLGDTGWYAINVSTHNRFGATSAFTLGGLSVDEVTGGVKRADGSCIEGLYAAGRAAVGLCSTAYMSGLSLADTVFSGRRAAASATTKTIE